MIDPVLFHRAAADGSSGLDLFERVSHGNACTDCFQHFNVVPSVPKGNGFGLLKSIMRQDRPYSVSLAAGERNNIYCLVPPCGDLCGVRPL